MGWPTDQDMASIGRTVIVNPTTGFAINTSTIPVSGSLTATVNFGGIATVNIGGIPTVNIGSGVNINPLPTGATGLTAGTVAAAAAMAAVLQGTGGLTTYISGFQVTGMGASTAVGALVTVTGLTSGTMPFYVPIPVNTVLSGIVPLVVPFDPPLSASAPSLNIQVNVASFGSGNTAAAVSAQGFRT